MSWGEVEKINSWAKKGVPLNHLIWLQDYKTFGEDSYVFRDKEIYHELMFSKPAINDAVTTDMSFSYMEGLGVDMITNYYLNVYGFDKNVANILSSKTYEEISENLDDLKTLFSSSRVTVSLIESKMQSLIDAISNSSLNTTETKEARAAHSLSNVFLSSIVTGVERTSSSATTLIIGEISCVRKATGEKSIILATTSGDYNNISKFPNGYSTTFSRAPKTFCDSVTFNSVATWSNSSYANTTMKYIQL